MSDPGSEPTGPIGPVRRRLRVAGRVQGVNYRTACAREARRLGLAGEVRNLPDGAVEVVAEGDAGAVGRLVEWCRSGPAAARVDAVDVGDEPVTGGAGGFVVAG